MAERTLARAGMPGVDVRTLALLLLLAHPAGDTPARERALARAAAAAPHELLDPARCVRRYLEAVRRAAPYPEPRARAVRLREADFDAAKRLVAPRTLQEIAARAARGEGHALAPWEDARTDSLLQSFELVGVRRAPGGAAVVRVKERLYRVSRAERLDRVLTEYLVAPVAGAWRVVDRRPGGVFTDRDVERYEGWWDAPPTSTQSGTSTPAPAPSPD